jgi:hypothetical protein
MAGRATIRKDQKYALSYFVWMAQVSTYHVGGCHPEHREGSEPKAMIKRQSKTLGFDNYGKNSLTIASAVVTA